MTSDLLSSSSPQNPECGKETGMETKLYTVWQEGPASLEGTLATEAKHTSNLWVWFLSEKSGHRNDNLSLRSDGRRDQYVLFKGRERQGLLFSLVPTNEEKCCRLVWTDPARRKSYSGSGERDTCQDGTSHTEAVILLSPEMTALRLPAKPSFHIWKMGG